MQFGTLPRTACAQPSPEAWVPVVEAAVDTGDLFHGNSLSAASGATIRGLAGLVPRTLAVMHGSSFTGDCSQALLDLSENFDRRARDVLDQGTTFRQAVGCPTP